MRPIRLLLILLILLAATFTRLWKLGSDGHPLLWDEAALGYNAYSIAKTGNDEYGFKFPLILKSFGDYKPGLYAYTAIPSILIFGLNEFAVRLPSAIAGVLIVVLIYLIANELFPSISFQISNSCPELAERVKFQIGAAAAALAALNPWLIHFSRGAWEANLALCLTLGGLWAFLKSRDRPAYLPFSAFLFGLTFLAYQSAKLFTPLIIVGLLAVWGTEVIRKSRKQIWIAFAVLAITILPVLFSAAGSSGRLVVMSAFSYPRSLADTQKIASEDGISPDSLSFTIYHGQWLAALTGVLERYFNHFSGRFLFYEGDWDNGRLGSPYVGQFYWPDLVLIAIGFVALTKAKELKSVVFLLYWIAISPLPAAFSRDIVQAVRSLNLAVPLIIIAALGLSEIIRLLVRLPKPIFLFTVYCLLFTYLWNFSYYLDSYFIHAPKIFSRDWLYGYKEAVKTVSEINPDKRPVFFTQKMGQPYIYFLFYNQVDPLAYQTQAKLTENQNGDVGTVDKFANFYFRNIYWPEDRKIPRAYFVGLADELPLSDIDPRQAKLVKDISYPNDGVAFRIVETL
jgi:4-amino-4-deoxy-L-arabinose transferase-like glycosyltransferase